MRAGAASSAAASFLQGLFQAEQPDAAPGAQDHHAGGGGGGGGVTSGGGSVMMHEDELAEQLALAMEWPIRQVYVCCVRSDD
jgi:hypothetical protein